MWASSDFIWSYLSYKISLCKIIFILSHLEFKIVMYNIYNRDRGRNLLNEFLMIKAKFFSLKDEHIGCFVGASE